MTSAPLLNINIVQKPTYHSSRTQSAQLSLSPLSLPYDKSYTPTIHLHASPSILEQVVALRTVETKFFSEVASPLLRGRTASTRQRGSEISGSRRASPVMLGAKTLENEARIFRVKFQLGQEALTRFLSSLQRGLFTAVSTVGEVTDKLIAAAADPQSPALKSAAAVRIAGNIAICHGCDG